MPWVTKERRPLTPERQELALSCLGLAYKLAGQLYAKGYLRRLGELGDAQGAALEALTNAAADYDPARGLSFSTVAYHYIFNTLRKASRKGGLIQVPTGARTSPTLSPESRRKARQADRVVHLAVGRRWGQDGYSGSGQAMAEPETQDADPSGRLDVEQALRTIHPRYADLLRRVYGLADGRPQSFREIGAAMGISKARVEQLHRVALEKLTPAVRRHAAGT